MTDDEAHVDDFRNVALKMRFEVDNLLRFTAATNPELSPGRCRRLVVDALRAELDRIQAWDTWDDPIIRDEERVGGAWWPEPF